MRSFSLPFLLSLPVLVVSNDPLNFTLPFAFRNATVPSAFDGHNGDVRCNVDLSVLQDVNFFFAVNQYCRLIIDSRYPISFEEMQVGDSEDVRQKREEDKHCKEMLPSLFSVSGAQLGFTLFYETSPTALYGIVNVDDTEKAPAHYQMTNFADTVLVPRKKSKRCYLDTKRDLFRCVKIDGINGTETMRYWDFEGRDDMYELRVFSQASWKIPEQANVKGSEMFPYFDDHLGRHKIWLKHNLQWFYNIDLDEQTKRGSKSSRFTTYHLANKYPDHPVIIPVYADSKGLVTAHCNDEKTSCFYVYNRVDAKSGMEGTCLIHLDYLAVVGAHSPVIPTPLMNQDHSAAALTQEEEAHENEEVPEEEWRQFLPLYVLIFCTSIHVVIQLIFALLPVATTEDLQPVYASMEKELERLVSNYQRIIDTKMKKLADEQLAERMATTSPMKPVVRTPRAVSRGRWERALQSTQPSVTISKTQKSSDQPKVENKSVKMDDTQRPARY